MNLKNPKGIKNPKQEVKQERTHMYLSPELNTRLQVFAKLNGYKKAADVVEVAFSLLEKQKGAVAA